VFSWEGHPRHGVHLACVIEYRSIDSKQAMRISVPSPSRYPLSPREGAISIAAGLEMSRIDGMEAKAGAEGVEWLYH